MRGRKRKLRRLTKHVTFLLRESLILRRIQGFFTLVCRHGTQIANRRLHRPLTVRTQLLPLRIQLPHLRLLLRREAVERFRPVQDLLLLLLRQTVEALQAILKLLLLWTRQLVELRITLQCALLLGGRQFTMRA